MSLQQVYLACDAFAAIDDTPSTTKRAEDDVRIGLQYQSKSDLN